MFTSMKQAAACLVLAGALVSVPMAMLWAQEKTQVAAPVPPQIIAARKVFVSNAGEDSALPELLEIGNSAYNQIYSALKDWGRFELASAPADADLVVEISFNLAFGSGQVTNGNSWSWDVHPRLTLLVVDPKTRTVLWGFIEQVPMAYLPGNRQKNFRRAVANVVRDLKSISQP